MVEDIGGEIMKPLERKEILTLIYITLLVGTIILLFFTVQQYIACANVLNNITITTCQTCEKLKGIGVLQMQYDFQKSGFPE